MNASAVLQAAARYAKTQYHRELSALTPPQLHNALSQAVMEAVADRWMESQRTHASTRRACYFSAEYLVGRAIYNNLLSLGILGETEQLLQQAGTSLAALEDIEDAALGNGGLGRLAACFLESAATRNLPLDGYGIRYRYGIFRQTIKNGFQKERADDWTRYGDPWSVRCDGEVREIHFADETVLAVPYDMPVIGYRTPHINTLRLWQAESPEAFDFPQFDAQQYDRAVRQKNRAEDISRVLYPNDNTEKGKQLRLRQQYFFCSASLQDILSRYKQKFGTDFSHLEEELCIQLNDTHPVIAIPEWIRLLSAEGVPFGQALEVCRCMFRYTNHTVMQEAMERWELPMIAALLPEIADIIRRLDQTLQEEFGKRLDIPQQQTERLRIVQGSTVYMANLALYAAGAVNGVAQLHTRLLREQVLKDWYAVYPQKFLNVTNGITQRRWLALANPPLASLVTELLQSEEWITDLPRLEQLRPCADDPEVLRRFAEIRAERKRALAQYVQHAEGIELDTHRMFDVQIKRLHEYKRQFLNVLTLLSLYRQIDDGKLDDFTPTTVLFAAKAAPGYRRAKSIIKLIHETAALIQKNERVSERLQVVFLPNYGVSYAERLVPAADISTQISTAGLEASGTGNMKMMLNGAITAGTLDGANVEIVRAAGEENNYIFGCTVEELDKAREGYDPQAIFENNPLIRSAVEMLVDGSLDDGGTGMFRDLYRSLLYAEDGQPADRYFLLLDFIPYLKTRLQISRDYTDCAAFARKGWCNLCSAGIFSSDRSVEEYAQRIWQLAAVPENYFAKNADSD